MTAPKQDPRTLELRGRPRPVSRLNKKALALAATGAALFLAAAMAVALKPPRAADPARAKELFNVETRRTADGLDALPKTYADVRPMIGGPSPGDHDAATKRGARSNEPTSEDVAFGAAPSPAALRNAPETETARQGALRESQIRAAAREGALFFGLSHRPKEALPRAVQASEPAGPFGFDLAPATAPAFGGERRNDPNRQFRKLQFLQQQDLAPTDNSGRIDDPVTPFEVMAGTVIPASLITGVNSDLPGAVVAQVTQNVYDTVTGQYVLIPQGARLIGRYDSVIAFGQSRALLVWTRIVYPDGGSIVIDNMPASDVAGYAGLADQVDFHTFRLLKGIGLSTLLGVGTELSLDDRESDLVRALRESTQSSANRAGQEIVRRHLDIQPTVKVRPGWPLRVIVHKDLVLRPFNLAETSR